MGLICAFLCVCVSAGILSKQSANFIETWSYEWAYQQEELINFCWWSSSGYGFWITFPLYGCCKMQHFRTFISISYTVVGYCAQNSGEMADAVKMHNIWGAIWQNRINAETQIWIPKLKGLGALGIGRGMLTVSAEIYMNYQEGRWPMLL